jgi:putative DNA methylase
VRKDGSTSGIRVGEIKTRKVRFFRPPNDRDLHVLEAAERRLQEKWWCSNYVVFCIDESSMVR